MNYWLVRAKWGVENKKAEFINNDEWINGYDDKYLEIVKRVETEDILLLADDSTITHYGKCIDNPQDGRHLTVDKWIVLQESISFPAKGSYIKTIVQVNDNELINLASREIEKTTLSNDIKIKSIAIENFTVFKNQHVLEFSDELNVVVGVNSTGKSHLLRLLYALLITNNVSAYYRSENNNTITIKVGPRICDAFISSLISIFKPDELKNLINKGFDKSSICISFTKYSIEIEVSMNNKVIQKNNTSSLKQIEKNNVFIPAKEIISFYEGFLSIYKNRETSFDSIYYALANSLGLPCLKNIESSPVEYKLLCKLEGILEGKILLERGRFYLVTHDGQKIEIPLIAEGLRKIGMIAQLLANGSLTKNSILFWDEPETNLNPRLIRKMAEVLMELSRAGMQIFIATHSFFLVKEIEILRQKTDKIKYFGLGFNEEHEVRVSQNEDFEYLDDIVILDEELAQADRFLAKEDD
jgi:predicted ATPase